MRLDSSVSALHLPGSRWPAGLAGLAAVVLLAFPVEAAAPASGAHLRLEPAKVEVGLFYNGALVRVEADAVPADMDVAVLCVGQGHELELKKKGKVWGVLWMNVGEVSFADVPSVYLLSTTKKLSELAPPAVLDSLGVGYQALRSQSLSASTSAEDRALFDEMIALKESEDLFSVDEGGARRAGDRHVTASCQLPAKTPLGELEVKLFGFAGERGELLDAKRIQLSQAGATALVSTLATQHGLIYGILAVVFAILVGLLTGLVFGLGSKKAH